MDPYVRQMNGNVSMDLTTHVSPAPAKEPVFRQIAAVFHRTIKQGKHLFCFVEKSHIFRMFRRRKRFLHAFDDLPTNHHKSGCQCVHFDAVLLYIQFSIVCQWIDVVIQQTARFVVGRRSGRPEENAVDLIEC